MLPHTFDLGDNVTLHRSAILVDECYRNWREDRLYVIGNEYGALCAVFARNEQDALDHAADEGAINGLALDPDYAAECEAQWEGEGVMYLGNASEPFDSVHAWIRTIDLSTLPVATALDLVEIGAAH